MIQQGRQLLIRFCQEDPVRIHDPKHNLQVKIVKPVAGGSDFLAYIDAIGELDGKRSLLAWKTASARYPEHIDQLLPLDPQLVCCSWLTSISDVAQVVFVRKRLVEVQYLRTTITEEQRREFKHLAEDIIRRIESALFCPTAAYDVRKTSVLLAHMSGFAWEGRI